MLLALPAATEAALPKVTSTLIVPNKSIGGVALGAKASQVTKAWGANKECEYSCVYEGKPGRHETASLGSASLETKEEGAPAKVWLVFISVGEKTVGDKAVPNFNTPLTRFKTAKGIGLGSTASELTHAYHSAKKETFPGGAVSLQDQGPEGNRDDLHHRHLEARSSRSRSSPTRAADGRRRGRKPRATMLLLAAALLGALACSALAAQAGATTGLGGAVQAEVQAQPDGPHRLQTQTEKAVEHRLRPVRRQGRLRRNRGAGRHRDRRAPHGPALRGHRRRQPEERHLQQRAPGIRRPGSHRLCPGKGRAFSGSDSTPISQYTISGTFTSSTAMKGTYESSQTLFGVTCSTGKQSFTAKWAP